jgi:hypothetical protein
LEHPVAITCSVDPQDVAVDADVGVALGVHRMLVVVVSSGVNVMVTILGSFYQFSALHNFRFKNRCFDHFSVYKCP